MALITCPECGRERVSDVAEACPECGFGIRNYFENKEIETEKRELEKLYDGDDANAYKLVVCKFYDVDLAAMTGLNETLGLKLSREEVNYIFQNSPYIISKYDSLDEAVKYLRELEKWKIEAYILDPNGSVSSKSTSSVYNSVATEKLRVDGFMELICFLVPVIGFIIYCTNVTTSPIQSKLCLKLSIIGMFFVSIFMIVLFNTN